MEDIVLQCTITEFKRYCDEKNFLTYRYSTQNQSKFDRSYLSIVSIYKSASISLSPDIIVFQNGRSYMRLDMIKKVYIEEGEIDTIFRIVCGRSDTDAYDDEYIFIAC